MFEMMDTDRNGKISVYEMFGSFTAMDVDNNGKVSP
jgi:Ca2+-binding EF-hand superfamily protein